MSTEPIIADLRRYENQQDRAMKMAEEIDRLVDEARDKHEERQVTSIWDEISDLVDNQLILGCDETELLEAYQSRDAAFFGGLLIRAIERNGFNERAAEDEAHAQLSGGCYDC